MATSFEKKLASLAEAEFDQFHGFHETAPRMAARIKGYWTSLGLPFQGVGTPWSAVFISAFVKRAGASGSEFKFSPRHSEFVHRAIANMNSGTGVFHGHPILTSNGLIRQPAADPSRFICVIETLK